MKRDASAEDRMSGPVVGLSLRERKSDSYSGALPWRHLKAYKHTDLKYDAFPHGQPVQSVHERRCALAFTGRENKFNGFVLKRL